MPADFILMTNSTKIVFPICNKSPDRAPKLFGHTFILCWRCTMVIFSLIVAKFLCPYIITEYTVLHFIIGLILILPMIYDGTRQYVYKRMSNNYRRAMTGALFGIGAFLVMKFILSESNSFIQSDNLMIGLLIDVIGHILTFVALKYEFRAGLKGKLSDQQRTIYADTYSEIEKIVNNNNLCYDKNYVDSIRNCRSKLLLAGTNRTCNKFEILYRIIVNAYDEYRNYCELNDPRFKMDNIERVGEGLNETEEINHVRESDIVLFESKAVEFQKKHLPSSDKIKKTAYDILNSMRLDLENDVFNHKQLI